jgi:hypothetical protein
VDQQIVDRRVAARFQEPLPPDARTTLRPGTAVRIIDLGTAGALVQASKPLRPGGRVHLQIVLPRRTISVPAHVLRCMVWALHPDEGVLYRGGLHFDHPIELNWADPTHDGHKLPGHPTPHRPRVGHSVPDHEPHRHAHSQRGHK